MFKDMMSSDMALSLLSQVPKTNHHLRIAPIADVFASLWGGGGRGGINQFHSADRRYVSAGRRIRDRLLHQLTFGL